jgi:hypothetical protein
MPAPLAAALAFKQYGEGEGHHRQTWFPSGNSNYNVCGAAGPLFSYDVGKKLCTGDATTVCTTNADCIPPAVASDLGVCSTGNRNDVCLQNSFSHVEIRNVSTNATVDVMGLILEIHQNASAHYAQLVLGDSPINNTHNSRAGAAGTGDILHLNLAPGQSLVVTRNPGAFKDVLVGKRVNGGGALFSATAVAGMDNAWQISSVTSDTRYHGGFIVYGNVPHATKKPAPVSSPGAGTMLVLRDRSGKFVDQAGSVIAGFRYGGFSSGQVWGIAPGLDRRTIANWVYVGQQAYWSGANPTYPPAADSICGFSNTATYPSCWFVGFAMEDKP